MKQATSRVVPAALFKLLSYSAYSSTLKMETTYSAETSIGFQQTTRCYISEVRIIQNPSLSEPQILHLNAFIYFIKDNVFL